MAVRVLQGWSFTLAGLLAIGFAGNARAGLPPGWRFAGPYPQGNVLHAGWAASADDVFVGGDGGVICHWDGTTWTMMETPTQKSIFAMSGTSPTDVWAVGGDAYAPNPGDQSLILHYDGTAWTEMTAPDFLGQRYVINSVLALAPDDVWATLEYSTLPIHFNGTQWEWAEVSAVGQMEGSLQAVGAVDAHDVFFAGTHGQILHKAGDEWILEQKTEEGLSTTDLLGCVWAGALDQVYVGGNYGQVYRRQADGSWTELSLNTGIVEGGVRFIWGRSPTEVYFLMGGGALRRYDGQNPPQKLDISFAGEAGFATADRMFSVSGSMVREFLPNDGSGVVSSLTVPGASVPQTAWSGVSPLDADSLLGWGNSHPFAFTDPLTIISEAGVHAFPVLPEGMTKDTQIGAVLARGRDDLVIAWRNWDPPGRGVHHWNGTTWEPLMEAINPDTGVPVWPPVMAFGFWRSPEGRLHAFDSLRIMRLNDQNRWETWVGVPFDPESPRTFKAFWARAENEIYLATEQGEILRFDGASLIPETTPKSDGVIRALGGDATHAYAVGEDGLAWYRDQGVWKPLAGVTPREGDHFTRIVTAQTGVYALQTTSFQYIGGGLARVWRFQGATATLVATGLSSGVFGDELFLTTTTDGRLYLVGNGGRWLLTDQPAPAGFTLQRVDRSATDWTPLGDTGVELRPEPAGEGFAVVAAWRVDEPTPFPPEELVAGGIPARQYWVVRTDGGALPSVRLRVHYDPALQPTGPWNAATLLRYDGQAWSTVPATLDPTTHTITANAPTPPSEWTFVWQTASVAPRLTITRAGAGAVRIAWPADAAGAVLETTTALTPEATWTAVAAPPEVIDGQNVVTLPATDRAQFFRLRQ